MQRKRTFSFSGMSFSLLASVPLQFASTDYCRKKIIDMGLTLFPAPNAVASPTVTAVNVPSDITWAAFDAKLREGGLVAGGSFGLLAGKVFRLGHMGTQADMGLVERALDVIESVVGSL